MGWTTSICDSRSRRTFFEDLTSPFEIEATGESRQCLRKLYRGAPWKGVLYTLWCRRRSDGQPLSTYVVVFLIQHWTGGRDAPSWGYKDMDHGCCPYHYAAPLSWLHGLSADTPREKKWIANVKEYWAARKEKRAPKFQIGD